MNNVINLKGVTYFPYEERRAEPEWQPRYELYLGLQGHDNYLEFQVGQAVADAIEQQLRDRTRPFIVFCCDTGSTHAVNRQALGSVMLHDITADNYPPELLEQEELKVCQPAIADTCLRRNHVLWMLASVEEAESSVAFADFAHLHALDAALDRQIHKSIDHAIESQGENYNRYVIDEDRTGYRKAFLDAWGVRIYDRKGGERFLPGYPGPETMQAAFATTGQPSDTLCFKGLPTTRHISCREVQMMECPTLFLGLTDLLQSQSLAWPPPGVAQEEIRALRTRAQAFQVQNPT